jgi:hypothetical protein
VLWWLSFGWAAAAILLCGLGAAAARPVRAVPSLVPIVTGAIFFPISWLVLVLPQEYASNRVAAITWLLVGPAIIGFCLARWWGRETRDNV